MKLKDIYEQKEQKSIIVSGGDYLTRGSRPSPGTRNELKKLTDYLTSGFLRKFNGSVVGEQINSQSLEFKIGVTFESNEDRINAVKYLRNNINTDYIRNVKSY